MNAKRFGVYQIFGIAFVQDITFTWGIGLIFGAVKELKIGCAVVTFGRD